MCTIAITIVLVHVARDALGGYPKGHLLNMSQTFVVFRSYLSVECVKHHPGESSSALGDMWLSVGILTLEGIFYLCVFVAVITRSL